MKTLPFSSLWQDVARRRGLVPDTLSTSDKATLAAFCTDALREGWEFGMWPEWCPVVLITPTPDWDAGTAYASGVTVWFEPDGFYYESLSPTTAGQSPSTNPGLWQQVDPPASYDLRQVFGVYLDDPREVRRARRTRFATTPSGVVTPEVAEGSPVWVHYRPTAPVLTLDAWSDAATYVTGRVVYRETAGGEGDSYIAIAESTNKDPLAFPDFWRKQEVPATLAEFLKTTACAGWLRSLGQYDQAGALSASAQFELVKAYDRATRQTVGI